MILYIHGFKSSGDAYKAKLLKEYFGEENVIAPTLSHLPAADISTLNRIVKQLIENNKPVLVIGSSLGGFYAMYLSWLNDVNAILLNPSMRPHTRHFKYGLQECFDGRKIEWTKYCVKDLSLLYYSILGMKGAGSDEKKNLLHFYISTDDAIIDNSEVKTRYLNVKEFNNSGHEFLRFTEILPEIKMLHDSLTVCSH